MKNARSWVPLALWSATAALAAPNVSAMAAPPLSSDMSAVLQQATTEALNLPGSEATASSSVAIEPLLASLSSQGTWADIDYKDQSQDIWSPVQHLERLLHMAVVYQNDKDKRYHDPKLKAAILKAYDAWFVVLPPGTAHAKTQTIFPDTHVTPTSTNWWHNEIGVQLRLGPAILLMRDDLSASQRAEGIDILARSWTPDDPSYRSQAANLTWRSRITTWRACLQNNPALVTDISRRVAATTVITDKEGLQADYSFWQHGPQLYSLGYGKGFSLDMTSLATLYAGTAFAFSPAVIDNISRHILDGQQWMMRGDTLDNSARGREIVRKGAGTERRLIAACDRMIALHAPRASEFAAFRARMSGDHSAPPLVGNRAYWRSDFMAQQRPSYYSSVRATSQNLRGSEYGNSEGVRSYYTGDGVNFLYRSGAEYENIAPVWDWTRLPGVTCPHSILPPKMPASNTWGVGSFAGGVSDGKYGATVYDYARNGLRARKAWFFFDREYVCLGAGITVDAAGPSEATSSPVASDPITTSINQCWLRGTAVAHARAGSGGTTSYSLASQSGDQILANPSWVFHDGVGYVFPVLTAGQTSGDASSQKVVAKIGTQTGKWTDVKLDTRAKENVAGDVFGLWIDHGAHPKNASYSYVVTPGITSDAMEAYSSHLPVMILANTPDVQAVYHKELRLTEAGFYTPGKVALADGRTLSVSAPCLVMMQETVPGHIIVSIADPHHVPSRAWVGGVQQFAENESPLLPPAMVTVSVSLPDARPVVSHTFSLPTGMYMGKTVTDTLTAKKVAGSNKTK